MDRKIALETLIYLTNCKFGYAPATPSEFGDLCVDITKRTGRSISLSSVKRLWGYVAYDSFPSVTILNILAQYNNYESWAQFMQNDAAPTVSQDSGFLQCNLIDTRTLKAGDRLHLAWAQDKSCVLECFTLDDPDATPRFRVIESHNIKLLPDDTFSLQTLSLGLPVYVTDIERGAQYIPAYIGAKKTGLTTLTLHTANPASKI